MTNKDFSNLKNQKAPVDADTAKALLDETIEKIKEVNEAKKYPEIEDDFFADKTQEDLDKILADLEADVDTDAEKAKEETPAEKKAREKAEAEAKKQAEKDAKAQAKAEANGDDKIYFVNSKTANLETLVGAFVGGLFVAKTAEEAETIRKTEDFKRGFVSEMSKAEYEASKE